MATNYTCNQTGAIAANVGSGMWGLAALGTGIMTGATPATAATMFGIIILIGWILLPLIIKLVRPAFIIGILNWIVALVGLSTSGSPWYTFTAPLFHLSYLVMYLASIAGIYFSYKSYMELKK